jgi:hypothetical protein
MIGDCMADTPINFVSIRRLFASDAPVSPRSENKDAVRNQPCYGTARDLPAPPRRAYRRRDSYGRLKLADPVNRFLTCKTFLKHFFTMLVAPRQGEWFIGMARSELAPRIRRSADLTVSYGVRNGSPNWKSNSSFASGPQRLRKSHR